MDHVERRSHGAHEPAAHRPPAARPLRGGAPSGPSPPPLKVYCVEPRDFRELVQRLTGAGAAAPPPMGAQQAAASRNDGRVEAAAAAGQFDYSPWFSAPLLSPAYAPAGFDGHYQNGVL